MEIEERRKENGSGYQEKTGIYYREFTMSMNV